MDTEPALADEEATFVVIGGGIAGVTCAELLPYLCPSETVLLVTASPLVKAAVGIKKMTPLLEDFDVMEKPMEELLVDRPNLKVISTKILKLDAKKHLLHTSDNRRLRYQKLCIATGGKPKIVAEGNPYVLGIRDTETVQVFQEKLAKARRVVVVGNGGIATELVYEIEGCQVVWVIKDASISSTFFDPGAAEFFVPHLSAEKDKTDKPLKRLKYTVTDHSATTAAVHGSALGPDWSEGLSMSGGGEGSHDVHVQYKCEIQNVLTPVEYAESKMTAVDFEGRILGTGSYDWPVYVELTDGKVFGCDFIISATGVTPNTDQFLDGNSFEVGDDGGLEVDDRMKTSIEDVFAAGDVCTANWQLAKHWFQMRLWTQARHMGAYVAKCMFSDFDRQDVIMDFCFEMFTHVTKFFGYKVVLLGLFNGQKLGKDYDILLRVTKGLEYVKVVMHNGRMQGAILVGETDMDETFENLILNQMDLSRYGEDLLDPNVDIEDYFD